MAIAHSTLFCEVATEKRPDSPRRERIRSRLGFTGASCCKGFGDKRAGGAGAAGGARDKVTSEYFSMKQIVTGLEGLPGSVTVTATTFHPNMDKHY